MMKIRSIATVTPRQAVIIERLYSLSQLAKQSKGQK
jgi:hypothetical protein